MNSHSGVFSGQFSRNFHGLWAVLLRFNHLNYLRGQFWGFMPRRATCCTDGSEIWHGGVHRCRLLHTKFHPHQCSGGAWVPENLTEFRNIHAPQMRIPCAILQNFGFCGQFLLGLTTYMMFIWGNRRGDRSRLPRSVAQLIAAMIAPCKHTYNCNCNRTCDSCFAQDHID